MSVITESLEETPIVIITSFVACEYGIQFSWDDAREFGIGEVVYYLDDFKKENIKQEHLQWFVKFRTEDGKVYSASQLYFIGEYEWEEIVKHICSNCQKDLKNVNLDVK